MHSAIQDVEFAEGPNCCSEAAAATTKETTNLATVEC